MSRFRGVRRLVPAVMVVLVFGVLLGYPGVLLYTWHYGEPAVAHVESCANRGDRCHGTWRFADGRIDSGRVRQGRGYEGRDVEVVVGPLGPYVREAMWQLWPYGAGPVAAAGAIALLLVLFPVVFRRGRRMERELLTAPLPPGGLLLCVARGVAARPDGSRYASRHDVQDSAEIRDVSGAVRYRVARSPGGRAVQVTGPANEPIGSLRYDTSVQPPWFEFRDAVGSLLGWGKLPGGIVTVFHVTDVSGAKVATWLAHGLSRSVLRVEQPVPDPMAALLLALAFDGGRVMRW